MACHMSREARITTAYARNRRYLRAALSRYHALLAQVPDKPGPVDACPSPPGVATVAVLKDTRVLRQRTFAAAGGEGRTAYQAHREGIRKLREWEDNDFDRALREPHAPVR
jgi:hypothetical protein